MLTRPRPPLPRVSQSHFKVLGIEAYPSKSQKQSKPGAPGGHPGPLRRLKCVKMIPGGATGRLSPCTQGTQARKTSESEVKDSSRMLAFAIFLDNTNDKVFEV